VDSIRTVARRNRGTRSGLDLGLSRRSTWLWSALVALAAMVFAVPIAVLLGTSFQAPGQGHGLNAIPPEATFGNYATVLTGTTLPRMAANSVLVTTVTVVLTLVFGAMGAYGVVRHPRRGHSVMVLGSMAGLLLPPAALIVPLFVLVRRLSLLDSYWALVGPYVAISLPVSLLLFYNAFKAIPRDIFDAADVDGAGALQTLVRVAVPLAKPTVAAVAILTALFAWNEFLLALLFIRETSQQTIQLAWVVYAGQFTLQYERQFALLTLISLPAMALFLAFQRQFVAGITAGATK
jgi:ABC-type glycerol-3-phosphate transport system permease component